MIKVFYLMKEKVSSKYLGLKYSRVDLKLMMGFMRIIMKFCG